MPANPTYPPRIMEFARRLYADGEGKSISEISAALAKRGYTPKRDTIRYWVDDEHREDKRERARRYRPPGTPARKGWQRRLDRLRELKEAGLSYTAVAKVAALDFPEVVLTGDQARYILKGETSAKTMRRLLWPAPPKQDRRAEG